MSSYKLMSLRIQKESRQILSKPLENILVSIKTEHQIHFCIHGLDGVFKNGFYHGILQLPENYPFSAPKFKMFSASGRFEVGKYVCTTFTSYHQQAWSSSWTIRTILMAILSFFLSEQTGFGSIQQTDQKRTVLAQLSLDRNFENDEFVELFEQKLKQMGVKHAKLKKEELPLGINEINPIEMNVSANDQIVMQQNIVSIMLPEVDNAVGLRNNNNQKCIIRMLYGVLIVTLGVIVFI